jgi:hypothetical protein
VSQQILFISGIYNKGSYACKIKMYQGGVPSNDMHIPSFVRIRVDEELVQSLRREERIGMDMDMVTPEAYFLIK